MRLLGAVLAGGGATRFGSDKAFAILAGRPLIAHAVAALGGMVAGTVICGRDDVTGLDGIADWPAPGLGPLGGLCAALRHAAAHGFDAVLSIGCDTPLLPGIVLGRLAALPRAGFLREAPIIGRWPTDLAVPLATHLSHGGDRSIRRWAASAGAEAIDAGCDIPNLNRPADLAQLEGRTDPSAR